MAFLISNSAVWQLIKQSDWVSKYVILLGLLIMSILCIAIIINKAIAHIRQRNKLENLLNTLKKSKTLADITLSLQSLNDADNLGISLMTTVLKDWQLLQTKATAEHSPTSLYEQLEISANQSIDNLVLREEQYLSFLGTSAAVSPLLGLFGTIWGLIHSFINISQARTADIAIVAPGIAEALITTLAGLIVAIPALIAFNYFSNEIRKKEMLLSEISEIIIMRIKFQ